MDFLILFITALMPVLKVIIITAIGAFLATKHINLLGNDARTHFNHVVFYCLLPAFVVSTLAESITAKSVVTLWFMPVSVLFAFIIGSVLGWFLIKITKAPFNLKGLVLGCCAAGNLGNMPAIIFPGVYNQKNKPFGPLEACQRNGMGYASLSLALGNIYTWSYLYNLVRISYQLGPLDTADNTSQTDDNVKKQGNIMKTLKTVTRKLHLKVLLAPATVASIIGLVLGVAPPFRKLLVGSNAPLRVIQETASLPGEASIPTMTLLIGGNLIKGNLNMVLFSFFVFRRLSLYQSELLKMNKNLTTDTGCSSGLKGSGMKLSIILRIAAIRFIILPVLGVGVLKGAAH